MAYWTRSIMETNSNKYITITQLNRYLKSVFDGDENLKQVFIKGEISNCKLHTRGHIYFTLKDETSRINSVMFSNNVSNLKFKPTDGTKVLVVGRVSVYETTGNYQIYVTDMIEDGVGNLYVAFEELKKKLAAEGLFDKEHKKKIPKIPKRIGIVTASTGAAIKDILTTIKRRFPVCETILFPSLVQGSDAAKDIVKNIRLANTYDIDTLIIGRGGGSIEDLWPFNEEIVARAIYESKVPTISAVGHEIDFSISDFVADLRAPTPTAAAELAVPDITVIVSYLNTAKTRAYNGINQLIINNQLLITKIKDSYILTHPMAMYEKKEQKLDTLIDKLNKEITVILDRQDIRLKHTISSLQVLNPLNTLNRGYAIIRKDDKIISSIKKIKKDDELMINLKDGYIISKVIKSKK